MNRGLFVIQGNLQLIPRLALIDPLENTLRNDLARLTADTYLIVMPRFTPLYLVDVHRAPRINNPRIGTQQCEDDTAEANRKNGLQNQRPFWLRIIPRGNPLHKPQDERGHTPSRSHNLHSYRNSIGNHDTSQRPFETGLRYVGRPRIQHSQEMKLEPVSGLKSCCVRHVGRTDLSGDSRKHARASEK